ncbi:hypothetical protein [Ureibacillus thermosphaericus]|uniref:hypothetical protein n=1 Tax=Ureibacillus thermosphaericus TaxID=51173 RepID=UPI0030C8E8DA
MSILIQQGYGMMQMNKDLASDIPDLGVILSPRALNKNHSIERLKQHALELQRKGVKILFDPQFYNPRTNLDKLLKFPYFEDIGNYNTVYFKSQDSKKFIKNVIKYQIDVINVDEIIIPNVYTNSINTNWYDLTKMFVDESIELTEKSKYLTIPIGSEVVKNKDDFDYLISCLSQYDVEGYYFVIKPPKGNFVTDEQYLYNLLDGFISLNLAGKKVILGYSNQQGLIFAAAGITKIASGNYRNVRTFDPEIFYSEENDDIKRRGVWYYDGNTLSEFKPQQITFAHNRKINANFGPICKYCKPLLTNPDLATSWKEPESFKHYLYELNRQWNDLLKVPIKKRIDAVIALLDLAKSNLLNLKKLGIRVGEREFDENTIDASLSALEAIKYDRNMELKNLVDL